MKEIYEKLAKIQEEVGAIKKGQENPFFKSKYFDINQLLEQIKPLLTKYGLVIIQPLTHVLGNPALMTHLIDKDSGESITESIPLPIMSDPQKMGSAITYYRRYALQSFFALQAEDDDGNLASDKSDKVATNKNVADDPNRDPFTTHVPLNNEKICLECNGVMSYKEGKTKEGKQYKGWFCKTREHKPIWA